MQKFRERINIGHPTVALYQLPDNEKELQYDAWREEYSNLVTLAQKEKPTQVQRDRMKELMKMIQDHKDSQSEMRKSILDDSFNEEFFDHGKDNRVYISENNPHYVYKYSSNEEYPATPYVVEYLQKKYKMLRKFLGEHIPKSAFVLGERRVHFEKNKKRYYKFPEQELHAITIQERVQGKTIRDMTKEERINLTLIQQIKISHEKYIDLKNRISNASKKLGLPENTLDIKLDLGGISKEDDTEKLNEKDFAEYATPNIMFDENKQKVMFIDFDINEWNEDKERIYQLVMSDEKL